MRDPIDALTALTPGDAVEQPPAAEIRRRGDARRRRRTSTMVVGALVAAAAVIVPVSLLNRPEAPIDPATASTVTAEPTSTGAPTGAVVTEIPDQFPIKVGTSLRDATATYGPAERGTTGADPEPLELCGVQIWPAGGVDTLDLFVEAPERWESRELATYASAAEAVGVLEDARAALADCTFTSDGQTVTVLEGGTGYDDATFTLTSASGAPGGTVVQLMRVGSAVLVSGASGEYTSQTLQLAVDDLTWANQRIADSMCLFTESGCPDTGEEDGTDAGTASLDDVPVERYLPVGDDFVRVDPWLEGVDALLVCGEEIWPVDALQSYGVMAIGPEQSEARFVSEWGEAGLAAAVLENARTAVASCGTGDDTVIVLEGDTGYDTLTYAVVQADGRPGAEVVQLMRVKELLLISISSGEYTADSARAAADDLTAQSADLSVEMNEISGG